MKHTETHDSYEFPSGSKVVQGLFTISAAAILISIAGYFVIEDKAQFYFSWLTAFSYVASISLGALAFVVIQHITRAKWSVVVRRIPEVIGSNIWVLAILFIPVILGMHSLYHWTHHEAVEADKLLQDKAPYLNVPFFVIRNVVYFLIWGFIGYFLYSKSKKQDETADHGIQTQLRRFSGPAIPILGFSLAFASFDWLMSLDPHWFSTMFGVYFFSISFQAIFPVMILITLYLRGKGLLTHTINMPHIESLGKLFFGFTVFYAYIAFSQFMLIYYANIPEEVLWFQHRVEGGYKFIAYALLLGRFVLPFVLLLKKSNKSNFGILKFTSVWILFIHAVELYWIIMPTHSAHGVHLSVLDFTALIGTITLMLALFFQKFSKGSMVPKNDPFLSESIHQH
ncbi:hypothetical protein EP331_01195 [bacterium]|nr:MAG: hypothetical protein EP331_01195 [bacterium]